MPVNQLCLCAVQEMTCQENERGNSKLTSVFNGVPSTIHLIKKTWGEIQSERGKFRKHIAKLLCFIADVKDRIWGGEAQWFSGISAVAELRTGLELVNNITEYLCSPEKDVRSSLPSTGCSLLSESCGGTTSPAKCDVPGWVGKPPRGSCRKF